MARKTKSMCMLIMNVVFLPYSLFNEAVLIGSLYKGIEEDTVTICENKYLSKMHSHGYAHTNANQGR